MHARVLHLCGERIFSNFLGKGAVENFLMIREWKKKRKKKGKCKEGENKELTFILARVDTQCTF